ncbi:flagellar hook capping FlgD N-terminal domain-containing protein [Bordetella bronchiseptica]|uniref:flagellar hook assembly protein FlgD n=1 Tax=Bordetella bronchiseptica TaxID=518 RepID=UPI00028F73B8|nr:flagellar hook capping FlgD N-terminal domain-containing protein [Bordetella bronchiseptica]KDD52441.1 flagellar hook capping protein [Bordetella bronchiseptica OSU553]AWQ05622.1 flagellar basal body rod modification protein [Bordetella bronchiseptica]KAK51697.1 flagellar hook capping protein [Bordetella bronchiseptica OSU054]KDB75863.1 flagellar hook capping protein [Bordetella bronchiseptica CA90 BB1334]KDC14196.1 flagellar hook capping protein [Bordetella bronchiseptica F-1]
MTTVNETTSQAGLALAQAGSNSAAQGIQDQFLTLLVTQLRNQDPLNPMENAELTSQLAQISTVEGINNLKNTMLAISGQIDVSQSMDAVSMIGKGVLMPGDKVSLGTDPNDPAQRGATPFGIDLQGDATKVTVKVLDPSGAVVRTMELGDLKTGVHTLQWDGNNDGGQPLADGKYSITVSASDADANPVKSEALTYGQVKSVAYSTNGLRLDLGLAGQISMLDVRKVIGASGSA